MLNTSTTPRRSTNQVEKSASEYQRKREILLMTLNRKDTFPVLRNNRISRVIPVSSVREFIDCHLMGQKKVRFTLPGGDRTMSAKLRLGAYTPLPKTNASKWACVDFDGGEHAKSLDDPLEAAIKVYDCLKEQGIPSYLERSGGGNGWHLWLFFERPVKAGKIRVFMQDVLSKVGLMKDEKLADGVEVFPKSDSISEEGYGNYVWLPFWYGSKEGNGQFYAVNEDGTVRPFLPEVIEKVPASRLPRVPVRQKKSRSAVGPKDKPVKKSSSPSSATIKVYKRKSPNTAFSGMKEWRRKALAEVSLEAVYGQWLTGKRSGAHWLQCRDPFASGGDQNPSAGVSTGTGPTERGVFVSFRNKNTKLSLFDFLEKIGKAKNFLDACQLVEKLSGVQIPKSRKRRNRHSA